MPEVPSPTSSLTSPDGVRSFRRQLTVGEDAVDVTKWFPESYGIPPRVRVGCPINDLRCGSSILLNGWHCKSLKSCGLGAGSPHWTMSATGWGWASRPTKRNENRWDWTEAVPGAARSR
jgi:hypothetical protein